jgi:hypothetical protein
MYDLSNPGEQSAAEISLYIWGIPMLGQLLKRELVQRLAEDPKPEFLVVLRLGVGDARALRMNSALNLGI